MVRDQRARVAGALGVPQICLFAVLFAVLTLARAGGQGLASPVRQVLEERCLDCHDAGSRKGGIDLEGMLGDFAPGRDLDAWVKVDAAVRDGRMPPPKKVALTDAQTRAVARWFEAEFVTPGGVQHAGAGHPRRLTREELQNSLEDILHIELRETVTNSRLHVIPDTIVEKFFAPGIYGASGFSNDAVTLGKEPLDIQGYARCLSLVLSRAMSDAGAVQQLFGPELAEAELLPVAAAREILDRFGRAAFRRPLTTGESDAFVGVYVAMAAKKPTPRDAIKSALLAILLSPPFLYRFEEPVEGQAEVAGEELAVRLSYFLWSAPPDQSLLDLAAAGELRDPEVLKQQVRRMLADPRRIALAENLGGEWFDYKKLRQQSAVDQRSDQMAGFYRTQYEEALLFFDSLIRHDQPIFSLVHADWAYINPHQARIYRLSTTGKSFDPAGALPPINLHYRDASRQVAVGKYEYQHAPLALVGLQDADRGGFITLGPTLSATSTQNRTSPIRRGVWVLERLLGQHFEQPKDVPDLEETQKRAKEQKLNLSHSEILKMHSSQAGCVSCHRHIDPIGFGLEGFDQLGISRPVVESNPEGEKFEWVAPQVGGEFAERSWPLARAMVPGEVRVHFHYTHGANRLDIRNVRLEAGELQLVDAHTGFSGSPNHANVWTFTVPEGAAAAGWRLAAEVRGGGGTDTNGTITVSMTGDLQPGHQLPNGKSFRSPGELKQLLLDDYREQIIDNAIRRVLAYALGRKIGPIDRPAIGQIREAIAAQDFRMIALIEAVVTSYPFTHKESR